MQKSDSVVFEFFCHMSFQIKRAENRNVPWIQPFICWLKPGRGQVSSWILLQVQNYYFPSAFPNRHQMAALHQETGWQQDDGIWLQKSKWFSLYFSMTPLLCKAEYTHHYLEWYCWPLQHMYYKLLEAWNTFHQFSAFHTSRLRVRKGQK